MADTMAKLTTNYTSGTSVTANDALKVKETIYVGKSLTLAICHKIE
jgi:hypothetical protein